MCNKKPYVATFDRGNGCLVCQTAQVVCNCGVSGPERYGPERKKEAISSWNSRASIRLIATDYARIKSDLRKLRDEMRDPGSHGKHCQCKECETDNYWANEIDKLLESKD
jgi:hypothetical protein